jgi:hypothetical protein
MTEGAGTRGGPLPPMTVQAADTLFFEWRREEYGWLKVAILKIATERGEFHGDYLADVKLKERNIIGAVVNAMVRAGILVSTGEHRRGTSDASHGRRSYVYRLTDGGRTLAERSYQSAYVPLPPEPDDSPATLFDEGSVDDGSDVRADELEWT